MSAEKLDVKATNGCIYAGGCGFIKFLAIKNRFNQNVEIDCGKEDPEDCPRNPDNPSRWINNLGQGPTTFEELERAFPNGKYR